MHSPFAPVRRLSDRRLLSLIAMLMAMLVVATVAVQVAGTSVARAAAALACDQHTIYGIDTNGQLVSINDASGATAQVSGTANVMASANNALGISPDGTMAYGFQSGANAIVAYDAVNDKATTIANADPSNANTSAIRGAVNPVNGYYYYASSTTGTTGNTQIVLHAYDPATGTKIGEVGVITGLPANVSNGDMAFSMTGTLFVVGGNVVARVDNVPTTAGTGTLTSTQVATLPTGTNSPGIAFTTDGYLYALNGTTAPVSIMKVNPSTGVTEATIPLSNTSIVPLDLATCNYPDTLTAQSAVDQRWNTDDQFTTTITSADGSQSATATSSGTKTGVQSAHAGSILALPTRNYTVTQSAASGTNTSLAHYTTTYTCLNQNTGTVVATGTGNTASFSFPSAEGSKGSDIVCTFTNKLVAAHSGAQNDAGTTPANTKLTVVAPGVLGNDTGTELTAGPTASPITTTAGGSVVLKADGSYVYTPKSGFSGTDTWTYTATDSSNQTNDATTATVTETVTPTSTNDAGTTTAGTALVQKTSVLTNDAGSNLHITSNTLPTHGGVSMKSDGTYTYTPTDPTWSGTDSFTYTAQDAASQSTTATVNISVTPVATKDSISTMANQTISVSAADAATKGLLSNDVGTSLHIVSSTAPTKGAATGSLTVNADGSYTFVPAKNWSGKDTFTYTVQDAANQSATTTVSITVGVLVQNDAGTTPADTTLTVKDADGVLTNDTGNGLQAAVKTQPANGKVVMDANGGYTYTPAADFSGKDSFVYTATDQDGLSADGTVDIVVTPVANEDDATVLSGQAFTSPKSVVANDRGTGTGLTATLVTTPGTGPSHGTVTFNGDGTYVYTPNTGYDGPDSFQYTLSDGTSTTTGTVKLQVVPNAVDDQLQVLAGGTLTLDAAHGILSNDAGDTISIAKSSDHTAPSHGALTLGSDGSLTYKADKGFSGTDTFTYTITDAEDQTATATVSIAVGVVAVDDDATATTGQKTSVSASATTGLLANDLGDSTDLTATIKDGASHGTATVASDGSYTYLPDAHFSGKDSFTYTLSDGHTSSVATVDVTVHPAVTPGTATASAGQSATLDGTSSSVLGRDDGTDLQVTDVVQPANGTATIDPDGTFSYTSDPDFSGTDVITFTVVGQDGVSSPGKVTVTVAPIANADELSTPAGTDLVVTDPKAGLLGNDHGSDLQIVDNTDPKHGDLTLNADGTYTYSPDATFSGTDSFTYTVRDGSKQEQTATVTIIVGAVATPDGYTSDAGTALTEDAAHGVLANDGGSPLSAKVDQAPANGDLTLNKDGSFTYTPKDGFSGTDTFTYDVTDGTTTRTGLVTLTVLPVANPDKATTTAGTPATLAAPGVLKNDLGQDLRVTAAGDANGRTDHGSVTIGSNGAMVYTPDAGFSGTDTVPYTITDGYHEVSSTVTVTVTPVAMPATYGTIAGNAITVQAPKGVLSSDQGKGLSAKVSRFALHGTVVMNPDGSFTYTPDAGWYGDDSFDYTTTDESGQTATATVTIHVAKPAVATADAATGTPGQPTTVDPLANDSATEGATLLPQSLVLIDPNTGALVGVLTVNGVGDWSVANGKVTFDPATGFAGIATVDYRVTDTDGVNSTATIRITYPTAAQVALHAAAALAFTGGASLSWLAIVAAITVLMGVYLRRRKAAGEGRRRAE